MKLKKKKGKTELQKKMDNIQEEKENKEEDKQDYLKENELFWEIYRQNREEEEELRLKSRCLGLKAGDKNIAFFHNTMRIKRAKNQIDQIKLDGQEIKGVEEIKKVAHNHFKELLTANEQPADNEDFLHHIQKK